MKSKPGYIIIARELQGSSRIKLGETRYVGLLAHQMDTSIVVPTCTGFMATARTNFLTITIPSLPNSDTHICSALQSSRSHSDSMGFESSLDYHLVGFKVLIYESPADPSYPTVTFPKDYESDISSILNPQAYPFNATLTFLKRDIQL
jgi:hypothetical protein